MVKLNQHKCDLPKVKVGNRLLTSLLYDFQVLREIRWKGERVIVFITTILFRYPILKQAREI